MTRQEIVKVIKDRRKELGISQEQLAKLANTHKPDISNIESGNTNITIDRLLVICNALELSVSINH